MQKFDGKFAVYDLRDTYHDFGEYTFKIVLNPTFFKTSRDIDIVMNDANNEKMDIDVKKWGRKIYCTFNIDQHLPDGVNVVTMNFKTDDGDEFVKRVHYWVIK